MAIKKLSETQKSSDISNKKIPIEGSGSGIEHTTPEDIASTPHLHTVDQITGFDDAVDARVVLANGSLATDVANLQNTRGSLATKDKVTSPADFTATGSGKFLTKDNKWSDPTVDALTVDVVEGESLSLHDPVFYGYGSNGFTVGMIYKTNMSDPNRSYCNGIVTTDLGSGNWNMTITGFITITGLTDGSVYAGNGVTTNTYSNIYLGEIKGDKLHLQIGRGFFAGRSLEPSDSTRYSDYPESDKNPGSTETVMKTKTFNAATSGHLKASCRYYCGNSSGVALRLYVNGTLINPRGYAGNYTLVSYTVPVIQGTNTIEFRAINTSMMRVMDFKISGDIKPPSFLSF